MAETFHLLGQVLDSIAGRWYAGHFPFFCEVNIASNILNHLDLRVGGGQVGGSCLKVAATALRLQYAVFLQRPMYMPGRFVTCVLLSCLGQHKLM